MWQSHTWACVRRVAFDAPLLGASGARAHLRARVRCAIGAWQECPRARPGLRGARARGAVFWNESVPGLTGAGDAGLRTRVGPTIQPANPPAASHPATRAPGQQRCQPVPFRAERITLSTQSQPDSQPASQRRRASHPARRLAGQPASQQLRVFAQRIA